MNQFPLSKEEPIHRRENTKLKHKKRHTPYRTTQNMLRDIATCLHRTLTASDIARKYHCTKAWVQQLKKKLIKDGMEFPPQRQNRWLRRTRAQRIYEMFRRDNPMLFKEKCVISFDKNKLILVMTGNEVLNLKKFLGLEPKENPPS